MFAGSRSVFLLGVVVVLTGCSAFHNQPSTMRTGGGIRNEGGATILSGVALDERRGSILNALQGTVPGLRILKHADQCPSISLRSHVTFESVVNPHIYVDGTRAVDTCILETLRTFDVDSVEVYPMGVTKRPGYATHAHGLILVFMRGAGG